ncbi:MAG TPA: DUF6544 family protein [Chitinophagaceae bacterium]
MLRVLYLLLPLHGLIHLIGFFYGLRGAPVGQFTGKTIVPLSAAMVRLAGVLWGVATVLFLAALVTLLLKKDWWWMIGTGAVVLSQVLIVLYWPEAKWGTLANVIIALVLVIAWSTWRFNTMVREEVKAVLSDSATATSVITEADLAPLPLVVQQWLRRSKVVGNPVSRTVHLHQSGLMRTTREGKWMPVSAEQYFTVDQPGFIWVADVKAAPGLHLMGRDLYRDGHGHMLIKALSLYPVANNRGATVDQGTLLRYLAEIAWFPSAALAPYIKWQPVDAHRAMATMHYGDITASGVFGFTSDGDMESFSALRFYDRKEGATLEPWLIKVVPGAYREFDGVRIPVRSTVTWQLREGDLTWYQVMIEDVKYNEAASY